MSTTGRKRDLIWNSFQEIDCLKSPSRKGKRVKCKGCGKEMEGQVKRMKLHTNVCKMKDVSDGNDDITVDERLQEVVEATSTSNQTQVTSNIEGKTSHEKLHVVKKKKSNYFQKDIFSFGAAKTSSQEKNNLDEQIARYIYATNSAFRVVENPEFIKLIQMLRPGYSPPSRKSVSNELLDTVYQKEKIKCMSSLSGNTVTLSLDGWSNIHNDPIVCCSISTTENNPVLCDSVDTSGHPHNANYLLELAKSCIEKLKAEHNIDVGSVVTDNTSNVRKMRELLLREPGKENILTYGCSAHLLNLLMSDIQIDGVKANLLKIIKYFRNNHFAAAKYKNTHKPKLTLPSDVRWNSFVDCLETYISSWAALMAICEENRGKIDTNIHNLVMDLALKRNAEGLLARMKPIAVALDRLQRSSSTIADSVQAFKLLEEELNDLNPKVPSSVMKHVAVRKEQALSAAHYLANILHPVYQGLKLNNPEREIGMKFAKDISERRHCPTLMPTLILYKAQSGPFLKILFTESVAKEVTAVEWWRSLRNEVDPDALRIVIELLSASSSTADLERLFSTFGIVQSDLRNRLGNEKASKLVFVIRSLDVR